jgi:hypothetical protein
MTFSIRIQAVEMIVHPGETARAVIGGSGRAVIGRLAAPRNADKTWSWSNAGLFVNKLSPNTDRGAGLGGQPKDGLGIMNDIVKVAADGSFRCADMPAGSYELVILVNAPGDVPLGPASRVLGSLRHRFTVPEPTNGRSDEPLDLGRLEVNLGNLP